jgi:flagellar biosynthesis chaperone FliJ
MIKEQIEDTQKQIGRFLHIKEEQMQELKIANIEYEKMKHLDEVEQEIILRNLAKLEAKQLDEIGLMLFTSRRFL